MFFFAAENDIGGTNRKRGKFGDEIMVVLLIKRKIFTNVYKGFTRFVKNAQSADIKRIIIIIIIIIRIS